MTARNAIERALSGDLQSRGLSLRKDTAFHGQCKAEGFVDTTRRFTIALGVNDHRFGIGGGSIVKALAHRVRARQHAPAAGILRICLQASRELVYHGIDLRNVRCMAIARQTVRIVLRT